MLFAIVAGVAAGWISAVSMIENYGFEAAAGQPQWKERRNATDHPAAPYAFGYFINQGQVPPPLTSRHFVRSTDDEGHQLRNECLYELSGMMPAARRWSMGVAGADGSAATLGAGEAIYEADGSVNIFLSETLATYLPPVITPQGCSTMSPRSTSWPGPAARSTICQVGASPLTSACSRYAA